MRTARRSSWEQGIRINYVAPCWIKSAIRTKEYETWLIDHGIEFGEQEDVAACMMRIASDSSINGMLHFMFSGLTNNQLIFDRKELGYCT
jgi:NAD(P)-dependent dehydrogenase (short-subunit alcohol dehydrogenase family)